MQSRNTISILHYQFLYRTLNCSLYLRHEKIICQKFYRGWSLYGWLETITLKTGTRNKRWRRDGNGTDWKGQDRRDLSLGHRQKKCIHFSLQPRAGAKVTDSYYSAVSKYIWNTPAIFPTSSWCQSMQSVIPSIAVCYHSSSGDLYSGYQKSPRWLVAWQRASRMPRSGISASFQLAFFKSKEIIPPNLTHRNITDVN